VSSWVLHAVLEGLREKRKRLYFQTKALALDIKYSDAADCSYILNNWGYTILVSREYEHCLPGPSSTNALVHVSNPNLESEGW